MLPLLKFALTATVTTASLTLHGCDVPFLNDDNAGSKSQELAAAAGTMGGPKADNNLIKLDDRDSALAAVFGATEIPYPVYPNGTKYRVGGENGLKIVVFQTDDEFETVDQYYSDVKGDAGMARLMAMQDYVRYAKVTADSDPWATHKPGIVIHQFNDETERKAVGASPSARTNIIMSF